MSPTEREHKQKEPKFTRGEKCIFTHIVITFILILILVIIYFVHLCLVSHKGNDIFKVTRRQHTSVKENTMNDYRGLGLVFLKKPLRALCNAILVQKRWSIAPGFCVSARSDPHLSEMLPFWTIKYRTDGDKAESGIIRTIVHSQFNNDDLNNNIGLFEHDAFSDLPLLAFATIPDISSEDEQISDQMGIASWNFISNPQVMHNDVIIKTEIVGRTSTEDCKMHVTPITDLRDHEFCVVVGKENDVVLVHGALLLYANSSVVGYFSWGSKQPGETPIVILNVTYFHDWIEYITT
ncbi:uncharacterized protein LOC128683031 [Plodia interpunctella]|uniref:uncharacterized protein LOC128683031 n=1 Tax=Plodia interpunctella TaxID=58824 RepID=UPI002367AB07|nr:uncharacterized protein LOC128683031 [Plodia interpunctella]